MKQAKAIISNKDSCLERDDVFAEKLALEAWKLETGTERKLVHQSLKSSEDKKWINAIKVLLAPKLSKALPPLPKPQPDSVFGYSENAFNEDQLAALEYLVGHCGQNYAMPDGKVSFLFLAMEFKAQATSGNHFIATN